MFFHLQENLPTLHKSLPDMMNLLYISILWVCACVESADPPITLSAPVGSTVILPCKLPGMFNQTSLIQWKMNDELVFQRSINDSIPGSGYVGRVDVPLDELRKGNCSLALKNIQIADDRFYKTFTVEHVDTKDTTNVKVITSVRVSVYAVEISARVGSTAVLPCEWTGLYITDPHVEWYIDSEIVFEQKGEESFVGAGYGGRLNVSKDELVRGKCTLVVKNVSVTDAAVYRSAMVQTNKQKSVLVQTVKLSVFGEAGINCPQPLILIMSFIMCLIFSR
ncbi:uncharacterized protein LOC113634387 [Tachysurus fulvidraco]|uniref:uncharacterized protein LOC113634387 n=1 Tax=Tachysurus fulvidraco TaxID=1234273 RepID=UPI001FED626E|nr:uncharacterized protein LOC113634387 [Tachysurus fulvidraco]